ncbi:MAG TPA: phosphoribosyltransferase [Pyrinomonadaceae bacterium]|nr:phosphoribosyltransferase [Pyrinomonadaceae bacterium]
MYQNHSSYLKAAFSPTNELVENALKALQGIDYDTMIGRGTSGLLVVPLLARALDKHFAIVRKPNDASHKECDIEGTIGGKWIFVDDFISTGETRQRVRDAVQEAQRQAYGRSWAFTTEYIGTYEYHFKRFLPDGQAASCGCGLCG